MQSPPSWLVNGWERLDGCLGLLNRVPSRPSSRLAAAVGLAQLSTFTLAPGHYMIVVGVLTLLLSGGPVPIGPDTAALRAPLLDTLFTVSSRETRIQSVRDPQLQIDGDTIRPKRRRAIEVSE